MKYIYYEEFTFIRYIILIALNAVFFFILTEKRRDAPNGKLLMIVTKTF